MDKGFVINHVTVFPRILITISLPMNLFSKHTLLIGEVLFPLSTSQEYLQLKEGLTHCLIEFYIVCKFIWLVSYVLIGIIFPGFINVILMVLSYGCIHSLRHSLIPFIKYLLNISFVPNTWHGLVLGMHSWIPHTWSWLSLIRKMQEVNRSRETQALW